MELPSMQRQREKSRLPLFCLLYAAAFGVSLLFPPTIDLVQALWPAGGIGLAAFMVIPRRQWPLLGGLLFLIGFIGNLFTAHPPFASALFMTATILNSFLGALVIRGMAGEDFGLHRLRDIVALLVAATGVNTGTAAIGAMGALLTTTGDFWGFWFSWGIANTLSTLVITPLALAFLPADRRRPFRQRSWEYAVFFIAWTLACWLSFNAPFFALNLSPHPYLLVVFLAWPAVRFGPRGLAFAILVLALLGVTSSAVMTGPSPLHGNDIPERLLFMQSFIAITALSAWFLSTSWAEGEAARREAEKELARLSALGDNIPDGYFFQAVTDAAGKRRFLHLSEGVERLCGIKTRDLFEDPLLMDSQLDEGDRAALAEAGRKALSEMGTLRRVVRRRLPGGELRWRLVNAKPSPLEDGAVLWDGLELDITEQREVEERLRASESQRTVILEQAGDGIFLCDAAGKYLEVNTKGCQMLGCPREELLGMNLVEFMSMGELARMPLQFGELGRGKPLLIERTLTRKDGTELAVEVNARKLEDGCILGVVRDIGERKREENLTKQALVEKEILLRELFHRSNNNMQVINALLEFQAWSFDDPRMRQAISDTQDRIGSMALVQRKLYETKDLSHVELGNLVGEIWRMLAANYSLASGRIAVDLDLEEVRVTVDSAIPCALILNELLSNAIRHGFPGERRGRVSISLKRRESGEIAVGVADDGLGVPAGFDIKRDGHLGFQNIIGLCTSQLRGKIGFLTSDGFACEFSFHDDLYEVRI